MEETPPPPPVRTPGDLLRAAHAGRAGLHPRADAPLRIVREGELLRRARDAERLQEDRERRRREERERVRGLERALADKTKENLELTGALERATARLEAAEGLREEHARFEAALERHGLLAEARGEAAGAAAGEGPAGFRDLRSLTAQMEEAVLNATSQYFSFRTKREVAALQAERAADPFGAAGPAPPPPAPTPPPPPPGPRGRNALIAQYEALLRDVEAMDAHVSDLRTSPVRTAGGAAGAAPLFPNRVETPGGGTFGAGRDYSIPLRSAALVPEGALSRLGQR